jgi:hypothetical protein
VPFPHVTCQGARSYAGDRLRAALHAVARETDLFEVEADEVGIFTGPSPVFSPGGAQTGPRREPPARVAGPRPIGRGMTPIYGPEHWIPPSSWRTRI